jgi:uncharacterized protein GlcG (DUF336 family)
MRACHGVVEMVRAQPTPGLQLRISRGLARYVAVAIGAFAAVGAGASPARAEGLIATHRIPAMLAMEAATEAVSVCAKQGYGVTAVVIDADAVRQAELRGDGAGVHTPEGAWAKARTAVSVAPIGKQDSTAPYAERVKSDATLQALEFQPGLLFIAGGVTIKYGNEIIGAIGVGGGPGGNIDEGCAHAGLDRIKDRLK